MEMARYSEKFKGRAVARLLAPENAAIDVVAREVGIGSGTLERWRDDAQSMPARGRAWTERHLANAQGFPNQCLLHGPPHLLLHFPAPTIVLPLYL